MCFLGQCLTLALDRELSRQSPCPIPFFPLCAVSQGPDGVAESLAHAGVRPTCEWAVGMDVDVEGVLGRESSTGVKNGTESGLFFLVSWARRGYKE